MIQKSLISCLLLVGLLVSAGTAQTTYSDSNEYRPRESGKSKKERKKKADSKDQNAIQPAGNAAGDVTVTLPISVLNDSGLAVSGLTQKDFVVFVDGVEVPMTAFDHDKEPITVILMIDSSSSTSVRLKKMADDAAKLVNALPSGVKTMVVDFNSQLNVQLRPTVNRNEALAAISKIKMGDGTSIYSAVQFLYEKLLPEVVGRKVIVLMTDGVDTTSRKSTFAGSLTEVEKEDTAIYPIYYNTVNDHVRPGNSVLEQILRDSGIVGPGGDEDEYKRGRNYLKDLASASGGRIFAGEKLDDGIRSLVSELGNKYYLTIAVPKKIGGSRPVRVRVNRPSVDVYARGSFVEN